MKRNFTVRQGALDGIESFLSVARHLSFRAAATELGVSASAISQAVRTLEARLGAALFLRARGTSTEHLRGGSHPLWLTAS